MTTLDRKDGKYLDFEEVTEGSVIIVAEDHVHNAQMWYNTDKPNYPEVDFKQGDLWVIEALANRPRVAVIRNLQRGTRTGIRVDDLLELDDRDILTIGPR